MISFIAGFFIGGFLGMLAMALMAMSKEADERAEYMRKKEGLE